MKSSSRSLRWVVLVLLLGAVFLSVPARRGGPVGSSRGAGPLGGEVHGSVYALIRAEKPTKAYRNIFLPDITVYLEDTTTLATSPTAITDLDGTFAIPAQPQAEYRLCWKATGYAAGCTSTPFVLRSRNVNLQPVSVVAEPNVLLGRVALKDGNACRFAAAFLGVNTWTTVKADTPSGARMVRANNYGEYVIPGIQGGTVTTTATCEGAQASNTNVLAGPALLNNLTLPNSSPTIQVAYATAAGRAVRSVAAGTTVTATVEAKDGAAYPLHYRWAVYPPDSTFVSHDTPSVQWKVPGPGLGTIYVVAGDGHGGNVLGRVTLSTTPTHIVFSGQVTANDAPVVPGATVTINGVGAQTNSQGEFLIVLPKEAPRYVINVEKVGYQMLSRALYAPVVGANFKLFRAQDFVVDPTNVITVIEKPPRGQEQPGVEVIIPASSLAAGANGRGALATTPLHFDALTYDMHNPEDQLPGDYGGIDKTGKAARLQTFGAADLDVHDNAGHPFNLAPGKTAKVKMPIDPAQLAGAPATIPVWHYDNKKGMWLEDGTATRVGNAYETTVTHFSPVNMDLAFSNAACTRIFVDTGIMPVPFKVRMTPLTGGFVVDASHQNQVIGDSLNVVVREPPGISVRFDMVDSAGNVIANASQTITTGAASASGVMWNPPPNSPYADCTSEIRYDINTVQAIFPVPPQGFLSYRTPPNYLDPATAPGLANAYYANIDPGHTKTTAGDVNDFAHWKTINGFDRPGETHAAYLNNYDLGFGRDMHMQRGGQDGTCANCIAYYVTNYNSVEDAVAGLNPIATVAMEYSPQNGVSGTPYTKFYVFHTDGTIANSADLDGNGQKYVPTLCIICHNGDISSMGPDGNLQFSRFIPFDLESFQYHPTNPAFNRANQEASFRELNRGILDRTNVSAPVRLVITHWYGNEGDTTLPNLPFNDAAVPSQWTSPTDEHLLYNALVKKSCRSCHTTRDPGDLGFDISWQSYDSLNSESSIARTFACTSTSSPGPHHIMPQAKRTFSRFWLSTDPNAPVFIAGSDLSGFQPPNNSCQ